MEIFMRLTAMIYLVGVLNFVVGNVMASPLPEASTHVKAPQQPWDPYGSMPDELKSVIRWKTLVGTDAIPQRDLLFGELELAPRGIYSGHLHPAPEVYYVLSGRVEWTVGDETFIAEAGTAIYTPPNTVHRMVNLTDEVARTVWVWWAPGGDASVLTTGYRLTETVPAQSEKTRFPDVR